MTRGAAEGRRVAVVTGGGGGIGAAIATELGRRGDLVVTVDPLVTLDGSAPLEAPGETTAERIVAAGGAARASSVSVTDAEAVRALFGELVEEHGRLDAVVNVAGISRPTSFSTGTEADWRAVLAVHLGGYLNVLGAALPIMAAAGHGRIVGVTSGSGWRAADTGAYGCAKRAVAALTWQLGRVAPPGVTVNALSPIAVTRMVTEALARAAGRAGGSGTPATATGGLSLGSMPEPEQLGPIGAHLAGDGLSWLQGRVLFAAGSEVAVIDPPGLLEVVGVGGAPSPAHLLEAASTGVLGPAEARQASTGGSNPRLSEAFASTVSEAELAPGAAVTCAVVSDRSEVLDALTPALEARGVRCRAVPAGDVGRALETVGGALDALVVAVGGGDATGGSTSGWERVLAEHADVVDLVHRDAAWTRAVADASAASDRPMRLVTLVDARTSGGRSRAQAAAQLSRTALRATGERMAAFAVGIEAADLSAPPIGELVAHLVGGPGAEALSGAELVAGDGWCGVRSHPRPTGGVSFDGPELPTWFDDVLRRVVEGDVDGARS